MMLKTEQVLCLHSTMGIVVHGSRLIGASEVFTHNNTQDPLRRCTSTVVFPTWRRWEGGAVSQLAGRGQLLHILALKRKYFREIQSFVRRYTLFSTMHLI